MFPLAKVKIVPDTTKGILHFFHAVCHFLTRDCPFFTRYGTK